MNDKPNCYECKWRFPIPGDCHSECKHPKISDSDKLLTPIFIMMGKRSPLEKRLNIMGDTHGIQNGWFAWPLNFDPTWLITCDGFEKIE
jgi:hypothetical protein